MSLLGRAVAGFRELRAVQQFGDSSIPPNSAQGASAGVVGERQALAIAAVLSCVRVLADDIAGLPFAGYNDSYRNGKVPLSPQPPIVREPFGPDVSPQDGFGQIVISLALRGRAVCKVVDRDRLGFATQLQVQHPDTVRISRGDDGRTRFQIGFVTVPAEEIVHIPWLMLPGAVTGIDPISYYAASLGLATDVQTYAGGYFRNGSSPSGVIKHPGPGDRKKAREVRDTWDAGHAGVGNAHRTAVLFGGADWTQISVTPEQAQLLATKAFLREEICGMFGVPLHRIQAIADNASQGGGKGLETQDTGYAVHTLRPYCSRIEQRWTRMIPGGETLTRFKMRDFLRADAATRAQVHMLGRTGGWLSRDEIRDDEDMPPIPDGLGGDFDSPLNSAHAGDGADGELDPAAAAAATARNLVEMIQKVYLGVGVVLTVEEARRLLVQAGADLEATPPAGLDA